MLGFQVSGAFLSSPLAHTQGSQPSELSGAGEGSFHPAWDVPGSGPVARPTLNRVPVVTLVARPQWTWPTEVVWRWPLCQALRQRLHSQPSTAQTLPTSVSLEHTPGVLPPRCLLLFVDKRM